MGEQKIAPAKNSGLWVCVNKERKKERKNHQFQKIYLKS